ncbi:MAG: bacteriohemerythrin [Myxococcota bacterium]|nr:bacteriohemerythrin [Myxococcota bacterium]
MEYLRWSDDLSVNVKEIDNQHKKIIEMLATFYQFFDKEDSSALCELIDGLSKYAMYHFETEEKYFDKFGFHLARKHKGQHQAFIEKVGALKSRIEGGERVFSLEVTNFVKKWLVEHIHGEDKRFTKCFNDNGLF